MKTTLLVAFAAIALLSQGCRRQDYREHVFSVPGMTSTNIDTIRQAILFYDGVKEDSIRFDLEKKTLTVKFDSMKVAQTNIRMAIEDKKIKVDYPAKTSPVAGYLNDRDDEVKAK